jgi:hypothetical protein
VTTTKYFVYPYTTMSASSIVLAEELDAKRIKLNHSNYHHKPENVIVNWGNSGCPYPQALNPADAISDIINKVKFFQKTAGLACVPKFATTKAQAANLSFPVVCRTDIVGADGEGIKIAETLTQLPSCSLYTEYMDKTSEYRIHLGRLPNGEVTVIARQKKHKSAAFTGDQRIWTGSETKLEWIDTAVSQVVYAAKEVFAKFPGLTFGAFDIVYNNSTEKAYVLEINSAPMLTAKTAEAYATFFKNYKGAESPTMETIVAPPQSETVTSSPTPNPAPASSTGLYGFVKNQLAQGHITKAQLEQYTPPITEEILIGNYINAITAA